MSQSAARSFGKRDTLEVDAMIESEIRDLEQQAKADVRTAKFNDNMDFAGTNFGVNNGQYRGPTLRDSLRSSIGGLGSLRNSIEGLDNAQFGRRRVGDSVDTLGSTGIKALLMPEFRLDGQKPDPETDKGDDLDNFLDKYNINLNTSNASTGLAAHDAVGDKEQANNALKGVNTDMDNLLKRLTGNGGAGDTRTSGSFGAGSPVAGSLVANSITDITNFLNSEMAAFEKFAEERHQGLDDVAMKEQKAREDRIREEGRAEARAKGLFGASHVIVAPGTSPLAPAPSSIHNAPPTLLDEVKGLSVFLGPETLAATAPSGTLHVPHVVPSAPKVSNSELAPIQHAIDNEMTAADEILYRMRALRTGLGQRLRRLDALHAQVMNDADSGIYIPPAASAAVAPSSMINSSGRPPLPPAHNANTHAAAASSNSPKSLFGTGADVAPPALPERVQVQMQTQLADKVAHAGQSIASTLTVAMEGMVNRLADSRAAAEAAPILQGAVPTSVGAVIAPASPLVNATSNAPIVPAESNISFGETAAQLREPIPPKSLMAQLDDMDAALGVENGPGAPVGLDKFLPLSVRTQNALATATPDRSSSSNTAVGGTKSRSSAPSPFRSGQWAPPPTLYQPVSRTSATATSAPIGSTPIRVVAPTDEELWLRGVQEQGASSLPATAPPMILATSAPNAPSQLPQRPLPWHTNSSDAVNLRVRPVEGSSIIYNRALKQEMSSTKQAELQAEKVAMLAGRDPGFNYGLFAQNPSRPIEVNAFVGSATLSSTAPVGPSANEREQYLRKMQALRQGLALVSF